MSEEERKTPPPPAFLLNESLTFNNEEEEYSGANYTLSHTPPQNRGTSLNPDSPAFVPNTTNLPPSSSRNLTKFRFDALEFTPTKTTTSSPPYAGTMPRPSSGFPFNTRNHSSSAPDNSNNNNSSNTTKSRRLATRSVMEPRLWRSEIVSEQLALQNHWLLHAGNPPAPTDKEGSKWPADIHGYCDFISFDNENNRLFDISLTIPSKLASPSGYFTGRARKISTGKLYTLVVFKDIVIEDGSVFACFEHYRRFYSPFAAKLIESFTTHQMARADLIFVHENYPGAVKLVEAIKAMRSDEVSKNIQSWICQLICLLFSAHSHGLALDSILKIDNLLLPSSNEKIVLNGIGIPEVLTAALAVTTTNSNGRNKPATTLDSCSSMSLKNLSLTSNGSKSLEDRQAKDYECLRLIIDEILAKSSIRSDASSRISQIISALPPVWQYSKESLGHAILKAFIYDTALISLSRRSSLLEAELGKQLENDRLFRLMAKFCLVNERQSYAHDQNWSETGNRHCLKLFRDFVFHCQDESGRPIVDFLHILDALDKLDAGSNEIIMLSSRNGDQCIFTSYAEIRRRLDSSFEELVAGNSNVTSGT